MHKVFWYETHEQIKRCLWLYFYFSQIILNQLLWQMYMCTIELGIQTNIFLKVSNMFWFSTCFSRNYQGILDLKLMFYQGGVMKRNVFTCDLLPHVAPYSTHFWLARISCNSVSARSSGSRGQNVYPPSECRFLC